LKKGTKKPFLFAGQTPGSNGWRTLGGADLSTPPTLSNQKFFASFFQKRSPSFLISPP
jgi:hypothetical protein